MSTLLVESGIAWLDIFLNAIITVVGPILICAAVAGMIYAVIVGIRFVKADDKSARDEAKQKLISVIIGIVVTLILTAVFYFLAFNVGPGKLIDFTSGFFG